MKEKQQSTKSWISFRVKPNEYETIHGHFSKTTCRKLSEYVRNVLLQKPVVVKFRNQSADELLAEMIQLKKELNAIGHNFNQVVHKLHTLDHDAEIKRWLPENLAAQHKFLLFTEQVLVRFNQIHQQWSSK